MEHDLEPFPSAHHHHEAARVQRVRVAAAVVRDGANVLLTQRPPGGPLGLHWEFPGGKIEEGESPEHALIREIQRDSLRPGQILHLDLYEIQAHEEITLEVPVHLVGIPDGVRNFGGVLDHSLREVEIEVLPADIPEHVELDVTALAIGHSLFVRDISIPKARILNEPDTPVCTVVAPRTEEAAAPTEEVATSEPELIRKPKAEAEGEGEGEGEA